MRKGVAGWCGLVLWVAVGSAAAQDRVEPAAAPVERDDATLESEIELRLTEDEALFGRGLDARVKQGTVTLAGTVKSPEDGQRAERLARVAGVVQVENQLVVEPPPVPARGRPANQAMTNEEREQRRRAREAEVMKEAVLAEGPAVPVAALVPAGATATTARTTSTTNANASAQPPAPPAPSPAPVLPPPRPPERLPPPPNAFGPPVQ